LNTIHRLLYIPRSSNIKLPGTKSVGSDDHLQEITHNLNTSRRECEAIPRLHHCVYTSTVAKETENVHF
jgi:hypothetical protein